MLGFTSFNFDNHNKELSNNFFPITDWKGIYNTQNISLTQFAPQKHNEIKINIIFKTNSGRTINIVIDAEKTISELIQTFFKRIGRPELFDRVNYYFIHQAKIIHFNDKTKIINYFIGYQNPVIFANDVGNLIGAKYIN